MIFLNSRNDGQEIAKASGSVFNYNPESDAVISRRSKHGKLLGGAIFYGHVEKASIRVHVAAFAPNALNRDLLWCCFHYPFVQLKCRKLLAFLPSSNLKSIALAGRLGLKEEARIKDAYNDGDLLVMATNQENCRWLDIKPTGVRENT